MSSGTGATILGRSVTAIFVPKVKLVKKKTAEGTQPTGKKPVGP